MFGDTYYPDGGISVSGLSIQDFNDIVDVNGGSKLSGQSDTTLNCIVQNSGGVNLSGYSGSIFVYEEYSSGGINISGYNLQNAIYKATMTDGVRLSGSSLTTNNFTTINSGGSKLNGSNLLNTSYAFAMSNGVKISGRSIDSFNNQLDIYGGVILGGPSPITISVSGGIKVGNKSIVFVSVTNCDTGFKCGGEGEEQYCAKIEQIQGSSSKFLNAKRKNPLASCFQSPYMEQKGDKSLSANFKKKDSESSPNCYGSSAFVAAITLCQQNIKPKPVPSNKKRVSTVKKLTIQNTENIQMLATTVVDAKEFKENKNKKVISNVKDTPQMENLKEMSKNVVKEKVLIKQIIEDKPKVIKEEKIAIEKEKTFLATNKFDKKEIKNNIQTKVRSNIKDTPQMIELNKISSESNKLTSSLVTKDKNIIPLKIVSKKETVVKNKIKSHKKLQSDSLNSRNQQAL